MDWTSLFYSSFGETQAHWLSLSCIGIFGALVVLFGLVVFVGGPKPRVRFMILSGLSLCVLLAIACSYLYIWHHFVRS